MMLINFLPYDWGFCLVIYIQFNFLKKICKRLPHAKGKQTFYVARIQINLIKQLLDIYQNKTADDKLYWLPSTENYSIIKP